MVIVSRWNQRDKTMETKGHVLLYFLFWKEIILCFYLCYYMFMLLLYPSILSKYINQMQSLTNAECGSNLGFCYLCSLTLLSGKSLEWKGFGFIFELTCSHKKKYGSDQTHYQRVIGAASNKIKIHCINQSDKFSSH